MPKLFRVILMVSDIDYATRFYASVFAQPGRRVSPGRHYFDCEGVVLACYDPRRDGDDRPVTANAEPVYLAVDDLPAAFAAVRAAGATFPPHAVPGVGQLGAIADRPWGERSFYATDPFGNSLCFVSRATVFTG